jgi:hypothetical protein
MKTIRALGALALLSAVAIPRLVEASEVVHWNLFRKLTFQEATVWVTAEEDVWISASASPSPRVKPVLMSDSFNSTNTTQVLRDAPFPLNDTMRTPDGIFKYALDRPARLSQNVNGTRHNFTDGRDFIYKPIDVELDAQIEVNIIVQEFCDICTDRSDRNDFHVFTIV